MIRKYLNFFITSFLLLIIFFPLQLFSNNKQSRIAIYCDKGVGEPGKSREYVNDLKSVFNVLEPDVKIFIYNAKKIIDKKLSNIDVIIFPGGSGGKQSKSLGPRGRKVVRQFVQNGGGYIGICAGAYLAQAINIGRPDYSLQLSSVQIFKNALHWNRGEGIAKIYITKEGRQLLPELDGKKYVNIIYNNGPLLLKSSRKKMKFKTLMKFSSDIYHNIPESKGESPGKIFLLKEKKGKGIVILVSGHPEATPGFRWLLPRMARWASKTKSVSYPERFIRPFLYKKEIMFTKKWQWKESRFLKILSCNNGCSETKVKDAMKRLKQMGSRKIRDYLPKLLYNKSHKIRILTIKTMIFYDDFRSVPYLIRRKLQENNKKVLITLNKAINYFSN